MARTRIMPDRDVRLVPWASYGTDPSIRYKHLWQDPSGRSYAGLIAMEPGASIPAHRHRRATHHVWIATGTCRIDGTTLADGSYSFVPAGVEHGAKAGRRGCTLFYLYLVPDD